MRSRLLLAALSVSTLPLLVLAACGDDDDTSSTPITADAVAASAALPGAVIRYTGDFASDYCVTARDWAAFELEEHDWSSSPAENQAYWTEHRAFADAAHTSAPAELEAYWTTYAASTDELEAVLERYGYDTGRFEAEASAADREIVEGPQGDARAAVDEVLRYEAEVCRTDFLAAAEVAYAGDPDSDYCRLLGELPPVTSPDAVEEFVTGGGAEEWFTAVAAAAPPEIRDDEQALVEWDREWLARTLAEYGYDFRRLLREGSEEDLMRVFHAAPEVRDADARQTAYSDQVCG